MPLAGETIIAGKVPGERIATTIATTDSGNITTTETVVDTVIAAVVIGRVYRVRWVTQFHSSVAADVSTPAIREDSVSGTVRQIRRINHDIASSVHGYDGTMEAEYTADATEDKTFVGTTVRFSGTGNIVAEGAATASRYLYVDFIR